MNYRFQIATKVVFGKGCITENKEELKKYGKRAVIVTGKTSAKTSGALDDVSAALNESGIEYTIYNEIENNPSLENVKEGGKVAAAFGADFIIGIGGGSPLDASKAVAVLAVNDIDPIDLYKNSFNSKPLPIIAIPTTSGTGSEVTPYSILTRNDMQTKMSFGNEDTFPRLAFMDARYTESMSYDVTVNTAIDALSHAVEGYISKRSTPMSDVFAREAIELFGKRIDNLVSNKIDYETREDLLYMSMLGGMVIAHTGTTIVHGLGYSLTYFKDIPHGRANGLLMKEYFNFNYEAAKEKIDKILKLLNMKDIEEFGALMDKLLGKAEKVNDEELYKFASLAMKQRSTSFNIRSVSEDDMIYILKKSLNHQ
ncbi:MAG: iron-containing alcohol dehydrogenase family protein [Clostridia bacterium]|nr:iron-containing alcohol dehydrogenase family protein [Clostridia bacterium]